MEKQLKQPQDTIKADMNNDKKVWVAAVNGIITKRITVLNKTTLSLLRQGTACADTVSLI
ncbi:hypothetical protein CTI12_AA348210 [Artemisia annua]|uniref:Uncharacterized protein n=1 Tax=Artemisia annua TaxID=35608 RepID=A0A2U1MN09_ARTAN|nr:hypothetical protein CTI12_AA348210 [Artemisia annua]